MPNGTYGGVRGRRLITASYSIHCQQSLLLFLLFPVLRRGEAELVFELLRKAAHFPEAAASADFTDRSVRGLQIGGSHEQPVILQILNRRHTDAFTKAPHAFGSAFLQRVMLHLNLNIHLSAFDQDDLQLIVPVRRDRRGQLRSS